MTGGIAARLAAAGIELPDPPTPAGAYVPAVRAGDFVFTAGQLPVRDGVLVAQGVVGDGVDIDTARQCAAQAATNALAAAATVCDLEYVVGVCKVVCYVAASASFTEHPAVANGASDVFSAAFGDAGEHAREAVGVASLPLGAPVEVSVVLQIG